MKLIISLFVLIILSYIISYLLFKNDWEESSRSKFYFFLLFFLTFVGALLGNFIFEYVQDIIRRYFYINFLGAIVGGYVFFIFFRKLL